MAKSQLSTLPNGLVIPSRGEGELNVYVENCPILHEDTLKKVHVQCVLVFTLYHYPDITNEQLAEVLAYRHPDISWHNNVQERARVDRRKFNRGQFRCMNGYVPEGAHIARAKKNEGDSNAVV